MHFHSIRNKTQTTRKNMGQNNPLILLVVLHLSTTVTPSNDSTITLFSNCLKSHTKSTSNLLLSPSSTTYSTALASGIRNLRFSTPSTRKPLLIVTPTLPSHVSAAILCSKTHNLIIKTRSGGHDFEGLSSTSTSTHPNFLLLDLSSFNHISLHLPTNRGGHRKTALVQAGVTLGELYFAISQLSPTLAFPAGLCPTVGVGGHFAGGGYGTLIRKHGLSIDHVVDAEIVVADGRILNRKSMGEDLFWAIRGGGGSSFGVILSYTVGLVEVPARVTVFSVGKMVDDHVADVVFKWQSVIKDVDNNLFMRLLFQPIWVEKTKTTSVRVTFMGQYLGRSSQLIQTLNRAFPELGLLITDCKEMSWPESILYWYNYPTGTPLSVLLNRHYKPEYQKRKSDYVRLPIPKSGIQKLWRKLADLKSVGMALNSYGGRMSEIGAETTAFPHRKGNLYKIQYSVSWKEAGVEAEKRRLEMVREVFRLMEEFVSRNPRAAFLNYRDLDIGVNLNGTFQEGRVYGDKYFLGNFERLVRVKTMVDPMNFFRNEQSIPVLPS